MNDDKLFLIIDFDEVREAIRKKSGLVMEFFRKGGGGVLTQSITLRHIFVPQDLGNFLCKIEVYGHFKVLFLKSLF